MKRDEEWEEGPWRNYLCNMIRKWSAVYPHWSLAFIEAAVEGAKTGISNEEK